MRVVASDAPSHTPADALRGEKTSQRFEIDTTPPVVTGLRVEAVGQPACSAGKCTASYRVSFDAEDGFSPLMRAEYAVDAGPWQYLEPVGALSDARRERYEFKIGFDAPVGKQVEHLVAVRVYDRHENVGVAKTVIPAAQ
jgi:hypothetical protein